MNVFIHGMDKDRCLYKHLYQILSELASAILHSVLYMAQVNER